MKRSKRKVEEDVGEAAEAVDGKARRVVSDDDDDDDDDDDGAFEEVYPCKKPGCKSLAVLNTRNGAPMLHGMCRTHWPYKERVRCSLPSCDERARVNGRCKLHKA
jgi:hypothetical protein